MADFNRREFLQISAASLLLGDSKLEAEGAAAAQITESEKQIRIECSQYAWEWSKASDRFRLLDHEQRTMCAGPLQPVLVVQTAGQRETFRRAAGPAKVRRTGPNQLTVVYAGASGQGSLSVELQFDAAGFWLGPVVYECPAKQAIVALHYFAESVKDAPHPSLHSNYLILPGIGDSSAISPVIPADVGLHFTAWLGHGGGRLNGSVAHQQWGLPIHYFCGLHRNAAPRQKGAMKEHLSDAYCWGLAECPSGDLYLQTAGSWHSLTVDYRGDLWGEPRGPGRLALGARLYCAVGPNYWEAIRGYYRALVKAGVIAVKHNTESKNAVALSPEFNTYGMQVAIGKQWKSFDETALNMIYESLRASRMKPKMFVIDADWEEKFGDLRHSTTRFPHFEQFLTHLRADGYAIGFWSAFMRCEDPARMGLTPQHMLRLPDGEPYVAGGRSEPFYILDCTQAKVREVLRGLVKRFMRRYKPDLVKFDFGYELPPLGTAAPKDMRWAGERLLLKGLEVVVKAMREENPDIVVMYYSLSPLFIDSFDLHSPDDMLLCAGDYDLEANRRFFFSSLLGEIGMPTYGSGGYDWETMPSIWFDSAVVGTLGSLNSFTGDEENEYPTPARIAKFNGLSQLVRRTNVFTIEPIDVDYFGPARGARISSWARMENGEPVLVALRENRLAGGKGARDFRGLVRTTASVVVASKTRDGIARSARLGIVPYGRGKLVLNREDSSPASATLTEYYFGGGVEKKTIPVQGGTLRLQLAEQNARGSWIEWTELEIRAK